MTPNKIEFRHARAQNDFHIVGIVNAHHVNDGSYGPTEIINKDKIDQIILCAYGDQKNDPRWSYISASELGTVIKSKVKKPLTESVLDEFLKYPEVIPTEWSGKIICFWGSLPMKDEVTQVIGSKITDELKVSKEFVPCMYNSGGTWQKVYLQVDDLFDPGRLSAEIYRPSWWRRLIHTVFKRRI